MSSLAFTLLAMCYKTPDYHCYGNQISPDTIIVSICDENKLNQDGLVRNTNYTIYSNSKKIVVNYTNTFTCSQI